MEPILFLPILIGVFLPLFILFVQRKTVMRHLRGRRAEQRRKARMETNEEVSPLANELIRSLIGKTCQISTGSLGESFDKVKVLDVEENWIRVERKNKIFLINTDYITSVKVLDHGS